MLAVGTQSCANCGEAPPSAARNVVLPRARHHRPPHLVECARNSQGRRPPRSPAPRRIAVARHLALGHQPPDPPRPQWFADCGAAYPLAAAGIRRPHCLNRAPGRASPDEEAGGRAPD
eukprot:scaffold203574_cov32-Tisochrysis_lutea.AAC.2